MPSNYTGTNRSDTRPLSGVCGLASRRPVLSRIRRRDCDAARALRSTAWTASFGDRHSRLCRLCCVTPTWRDGLRDEASFCEAGIPRPRFGTHAGRARDLRSAEHWLLGDEAGYFTLDAQRDSALRILRLRATFSILRHSIEGDGFHGVEVVTVPLNKPHAAPTAMSFLFHAERQWRGVADGHLWTSPTRSP